MSEVYSNLTCMHVIGDVGNRVGGFQMDGYRGFLKVNIDGQSVHAMGWLDWVGLSQVGHTDMLCSAYFWWLTMRVKSWLALSLSSGLSSGSGKSGRGMGLI